MNKKLLTGLLAVSCLVGLSSCGSKVLADTDHHSWVIHGENEIRDADGNWVENGWDGKSSDLYKASAMTPTSVKEVKEVSEEVAAKLKEKELKCLYMGEVRLGVRNVTKWSVNVQKPDGTLWTRNASFVLKAAVIDYIEEDDNYTEYEWISNANTANVESLTPDTLFYPVWQKNKDENGFDWMSNPACIGEAGVYTFIVAQYKTASAPGIPGYGAALVLKEACTAATEDVQILTPFADLSTANIGIIGGFADNNWDSDVNLEYVDGKLVGTFDIAEGVEFKFRANDEWTFAWGSSYVEKNENFDLTGDNIKCLVGGTYKVEMTVASTGLNANIKLTKTA